MRWKTAWTGLLLFICHTVFATDNPSVEVQQLRSALAREQAAIVLLEQIREKQNKHLHHLQQTLATQIKAAAKLTTAHNRKELLGYHARLAHSQIQLINHIRSAEAANADLLSQRILHQSTLKKLLLKEIKKSHVRPPPPPLPIAATSNDIHNSVAIHAIARGKVIFAEWLRGFGLMIIISHGHGYMSLYGQNKSLYAKTGDNVSKGQLIALAENEDKKPLKRYFELRRNGTPLPPEQNKFILN